MDHTDSNPAAIGVTRIRPQGRAAYVATHRDVILLALALFAAFSSVGSGRSDRVDTISATFKANARRSGHAEVPGRGELHRRGDQRTEIGRGLCSRLGY